MPEFQGQKKHISSDDMNTGWERFSSVNNSIELFKKALRGDTDSGDLLAKIVTSKVAEKQMLDLGEEAYFQRAIKKIAEGEKPNVAFLMMRKNGKKDESHIPYRDPWIYDKFCEQLDSGKDFSEAANSIHEIMVEFHSRAQSKLAEAEAVGIVQLIEEAERLLRVTMPISPERIRDIFEKYDIKFRQVLRSTSL